MATPDVVDRVQRGILGRSLVAMVAVSDRIRRAILAAMSKFWRGDLREWEQEVREILRDGGELMLAQLDYNDLVSWVAGFGSVEGDLPPFVRELLETPPPPAGLIRNPPRQPPEPPRLILPGEEPVVRFPKLEAAARSLTDRGILNRADFDLLTTEERAGTFTVAYIEEDTIQRIRDTLATDVREGTSLRTFREKVDEDLGGSPIGPAHLETVYRTNVQASFRDGREALAQNPIVEELFPFQRYDAINDDRVRPDHLALETLGLNGTGVYWRSDPVWQFHTPPWDYNCRCAATAITVEQAARLGVEQAIAWLDTGVRPLPEYRLDAVRAAGVEANPGWGSRGSGRRAA